jgi:hypothetical protein
MEADWGFGGPTQWRAVRQGVLTAANNPWIDIARERS